MAEMVMTIILHGISVVLMRVGGFLMKVFVNSWRNRLIKHIEQTVTYERIKIKTAEVGQIPQLTLTWVVRNRSMTSITISDISGGLYVGAWRIGVFSAHTPPEKQLGYDKSPIVTVRKKVLKKGDASEIEVTIFPPIEFWLTENENCTLYDTVVRVTSFWGSAVIRIMEERIPIEDIHQVALSYRDRLSNKLNRLLAKEP